MKQADIDNGQLGGTIRIIVNSMFVFNFVTFVNTSALIYDSFLYRYVSLYTGIAILFICICLWWYFYYAVIFPSTIKFANRQNYIHSNPIRDDLEKIKEQLGIEK